MTYAASSYMEYTKEWEGRMKIWDEAIADLENAGETKGNPKPT